jgi:hypothetical protein
MARSKSLCAKVCEKVCAELNAHWQSSAGIEKGLSVLAVLTARRIQTVSSVVQGALASN